MMRIRKWMLWIKQLSTTSQNKSTTTLLCQTLHQSLRKSSRTRVWMVSPSIMGKWRRQLQIKSEEYRPAKLKKFFMRSPVTRSKLQRRVRTTQKASIMRHPPMSVTLKLTIDSQLTCVNEILRQDEMSSSRPWLDQWNDILPMSSNFTQAMRRSKGRRGERASWAAWRCSFRNTSMKNYRLC